MKKYQLDFIKLKLYNVDTKNINWDYLIEHPVLKRHYYLSLTNDNKYHGKNFDLYIDKGNNITIRMSVPYLLENHNFCGVSNNDFGLVLFHFYNSLGINLPDARVLEFEYGAYEKIQIEANKYLNNIIGVFDYKLEKSTPYMKMFSGDKGIHYKIYDAIANAKKKKTFTRGNYPESGLIKHELKFLAPDKIFKHELTAFDLSKDSYGVELKKLLDHHKNNLVFKKELLHRPLKNDLTNILFTSIKNLEQKLNVCAFDMISEVINKSDMTASQKSKRRKSFKDLEIQYNQGLNNR